jgi:hypothetical protein
MTPDHTDLIRRLKAAPCGSRELSDEVARALGWKEKPDYPRYKWVTPEFQRRTRPPDFTQSLDAAMQAIPEGWRWTVGASRDGTFRCFLGAGEWTQDRDDYREREGHAATAPLAICAASLRAMDYTAALRATADGGGK